MKNYPNQASSFERIRETLEVIAELRDQGKDVNQDAVLGYACAQRGVYTFRGLDRATATQSQLDARIKQEKAKPRASQGVLTYARELRRTLRDLGWIDHNGDVTAAGEALLATPRNSVEEQAVLVEGLLNIEAYDAGQVHYHHPVLTMLRLLALGPSLHREGLELALEPEDDSEAEFQRVAKLYKLGRGQRMRQLGISQHQRANAVKIFPTLAVTAGLIVEDDDGYFSLSQDGWKVIGQAPAKTAPLKPKAAKKAIAKRRGRRTTVGKLVTSKTVAAKRSHKPPKTLTPEEQARAAEKLRERTSDHQALVKRVAEHIGDDVGELFEDEFSYDLLWVPDDDAAPLVLFEMKTISDATDAYARVRHAVGQLSYYEYFYVEPTWQGRAIQQVAAFDADIPEALAKYLEHEGIGAIVVEKGAQPRAINPLGQKALDALPQKPAGSA